MGIRNTKSSTRLETSTYIFLQKQLINPDFQKIQQFSNQAINDIKQTLRSLKGCDEGEMKRYLTSIDYYYIKADEAAIRNPDPRGSHIDGGELGLIVSTNGESSRFRDL